MNPGVTEVNYKDESTIYQFVLPFLLSAGFSRAHLYLSAVRFMVVTSILAFSPSLEQLGDTELSFDQLEFR